MSRSIRARLALFASVAMALLCLATSSLLLWGVHNTARDIQTNHLIASALHVVHTIKTRPLPKVVPLDVDGLQVVDHTGRVVSSTPNLAGSPRLIDGDPGAGKVTRVTRICGLPQFGGQCKITAIVRVYESPGDWIVYAFGPVTPWYVHPGLLAFLIGVSAGLVALTWFGVSRVVARTLAPVHTITEHLAEITAGDGGMRVPVPEDAEEIKTLAETGNRTLSRLEEALEQQRKFASDASHDLRSPITAMRAELEEALLAPDETDWRATGDRLIASLDRLQNVVSDLLTLARLDAQEPGRSEPVDLAELVAAESGRPRSKSLGTSLRSGVVVTADRGRLARLLNNLLDNAERHAESTITVTVRRDGEAAVLEVLDDGAGIAPEDRDVVFRRFARLDAARNRDAGGTGLGLPIAREIAKAYGGTLTIEDSDTGARFVLRMPARKD
ncbi:MAG TPA: HAMP domain-containing sensor histidine kinase [Nonomuraea sp.]|nr:HAMP domain-containing sensor histidine kinase [Nonomuraea sp.]